jgi:2-oxoglutarate ferredoxin oxidoreductase subunit alpha
MTGSAHNRQGELKKNDAGTIDVLYHLEDKVAARKADLEFVQCDIEEHAETLVVSFGVTARAMLEAVGAARKNGKRVSSMKVLSLFPLPEEAIRREARRVTRIVVAEENLNGQYRRLIEPFMSGKEVIGVTKIGSMITPAEIAHAIL